MIHLEIIIPSRILTYNKEQLDRWVIGSREDCIDSYCKKLKGSKGFGEYIAGKFYESLGYQWIHHDYNLFGGNKLGKYPEAETILRKHFGDARYESGRGYYSAFSQFVKVEEPDLLIYKPDCSEILFVECKRHDTNDKLRESQIRGLALLKLLFHCAVEVVEIIEEGSGQSGEGQPMVWQF
ncbi:hypothetical protein Back11_60810 [Paenibacillus baekrokdamisoli]|uniref:Uncharacterized protein n=1 Tax=Paenibacillus baekrokdamisoli TaxID=1712516 RepID=A0A3G9J1V1_9BACL|nr:hypothetical protein [Paenibacillus baekrokdamisoli]MBB3072151.1 hypothetical protein [Paenibacillus baekrokdamisoli]BBH24736.1 hypothetical protein Back11_60810 [Paenibacillus baekrokdamisoli]